MRFRFSSNVVLAKVRAMYGKRIRLDDYESLLNCGSVGEVAAYLKNNTGYSDVLAAVNEREIHRGQLEALLKNKMFNNLAALCRYELSTSGDFSDYIIRRAEIEQIIRSLVHLFSSDKTQGSYKLPSYFDKHTRIDLGAISKAKTYKEFLVALGDSPYKKLLQDVELDEYNMVNLSEVESILYNYLYEGFFSSMEKNTGKRVKEKTKQIFETYIDFGNFVRIIRAKRDGSLPKFAVLKHGSLKKRYIKEMLEADSEDEVFSVMESTNQGKKLKNLEYSYIDQIQPLVVYKKCRNDLHMSIDASVVLVSYKFLMQIELSNLVKIIEGIRYKLNRDEIKRLLILN